MPKKKMLKLIFEPNIIYEGILTTENNEGNPHMASMGFSFNDEYDIVVRPFKDTRSYNYLKNKGMGVINIVNDIELFFKATYGTASKSDFFPSYKLKIPRLKESNFYIEGRVKKIDENEVRASFILEPVYVYAKKTYERPFTRVEFAVIEALIHSTRIKVFMEMKLYEEVDRLVSLIDHYDKLIRRIAPNSKYTRIMDEINKIVDSNLKFKSDH
ncbi:MAG TPA: DUF447 domain-containing protein [Geobacterales bacterium]|nr:DUF447 domain-containing protein [Geobacterales bacterium]